MSDTREGPSTPARDGPGAAPAAVRPDGPAGILVVPRLRSLFEAVGALVDDLVDGPALPMLLNRVVETAARMVDARSGALTARGPGGATEQLVDTSMDGATVAALGSMPEGHGLLGQLDDGRSIRLHRISDYPASFGLPGQHPTMSTFLGIPLRVRDQLLGTLYLTDKRGGVDFTVEDGRLVEVFAAAAGIAIDNARLSAECRRRARWSEAFAEIRAALLSGSDSDEALLLIAARARELTAGDAALLLLPDPSAPAEQLMVMVAEGRDAAELRGLRTPVAGSIAGRVYRSGVAMSIDDVADPDTHEPAFDHHQGYGPAVLAPLGGPSEMGVLVIAKPTGTSPLGQEATAVAIDFAGQAALALRMAEAQRSQRDVALLADRERIGRDLHDQVIQRLFATGMSLENITRQVTAPALQGRLQRAVDDLDQTVRDIRRTIFELQEPVDGPQTLRQQIIAVLETAMGTSRLNLEVRVADSVDAAVPPEVAGQALAVLREAVTNVIRHARGSMMSVSVTAADRLVIEVTDDGVGIAPSGRRSGLTNLADRATRLGGVLTLDRNPAGHGARLVWDVPLPQGARVVAGPAPGR